MPKRLLEGFTGYLQTDGYDGYNAAVAVNALTHVGGRVKASANLYSLIETAKANGLEPYAYLRCLFTELPNAETVETIEALLPGNLSKDQIRLG